jgi:hypothetical protein
LEFAIALPLLAVILVGTYDFGQAFNVKQKLVATTREAARAAANQSTSDLTNPGGNNCAPAPDSVCALRDIVSAYLLASNISDCGLGSATIKPLVGLQWSFSAGGCPGGNFVLTVNRGNTYTISVPSGNGNVTMTVESTQVTLSYPYQWHFNHVIQFLVPGATYAAVTPIVTSAVAENLN